MYFYYNEVISYFRKDIRRNFRNFASTELEHKFWKPIRRNSVLKQRCSDTFRYWISAEQRWIPVRLQPGQMESYSAMKLAKYEVESHPQNVQDIGNNCTDTILAHLYSARREGNIGQFRLNSLIRLIHSKAYFPKMLCSQINFTFVVC